ncbi:MAG: hypothetical protein K9I85_11295 [Saprospiraceae bacterium]|nr:hypothetical protein [Saprospiraceae bacterium]
MFKLLLMVLVGYFAYRTFFKPKPPLPPNGGQNTADQTPGEYTDYEEIE